MKYFLLFMGLAALLLPTQNAQAQSSDFRQRATVRCIDSAGARCPLIRGFINSAALDVAKKDQVVACIQANGASACSLNQMPSNADINRCFETRGEACPLFSEIKAIQTARQEARSSGSSNRNRRSASEGEEGSGGSEGEEGGAGEGRGGPGSGYSCPDRGDRGAPGNEPPAAPPVEPAPPIQD